MTGKSEGAGTDRGKAAAASKAGAELERVNGVIGELVKAAQAGELTARGDSSKAKNPAEKQLIEGVNAILDAIAGPTRRFAEYAAELATGSIPEAIGETYEGDLEQMRRNVNGIGGALSSFIDEVRQMSIQHAAGDIDVVLPADQLDGDYRIMAQGVNDMVREHIAVTKKAMACVAEFGAGDFDAELERFPGKKAFINDTVELVRTQIKETWSEVDRLSRAATNGDLTQRSDLTKFRGDWARMLEGFNQIFENLTTALSHVDRGTAQIDEGSNQVAAASQSLAEGASEQASNLEQISAALDEISAQTMQNADSARDAQEAANEAHQNVERGQSEMAQMNQAMSEIKASSSEISKIIKVIDEIAFQTNLLALNAAVEAARAGEAGKGFAVVAEEVRNLAQRSAEAAKNTSSMIEQAAMRSDNGVAIVQRVDEALELITGATGRVTKLIEQIAAASDEQAQGIAQVNKGIAQLDAVTQQNAGNAQQLASSAQETSALISTLREVIDGFDLGTTGGDPEAFKPAVGRQPARNASPRPKTSTSSAPPRNSRDEREDDPRRLIPLNDEELTAF